MCVVHKKQWNKHQNTSLTEVEGSTLRKRISCIDVKIDKHDQKNNRSILFITFNTRPDKETIKTRKFDKTSQSKHSLLC